MTFSVFSRACPDTISQIRNQQVIGSSPIPGSIKIMGLGDIPDPFFLAKQLNVIKS